jgi:hypothetical protein
VRRKTKTLQALRRKNGLKKRKRGEQMSDYEELRYEMQYYENEHYNELRKLEAEENASPTLKADRDAWKARAERAEAELKAAVADLKQSEHDNGKCDYCRHRRRDGGCASIPVPYSFCSDVNRWEWRGAEKGDNK